MNRREVVVTVFGIVVSVLLLGAASTFAQANSIRVLVHGKHVGDNISYHYTVINNGATAFNNFTIGVGVAAESDQFLPPGHRVPQLDKRPVGWRFGETGEIGAEIILIPASTTQPAGWVSWVYGQQEASDVYLEWRIPFESNLVGVSPGQQLSGFSVTVPRATDPVKRSGTGWAYLNGGFEVGYWEGGKPVEFRGPIERQDTTAPTLTVSLSPATIMATSGLVAVSATLTVRDDYDPAPEIRLESITANVPLDPTDVLGAQLGSDDRSFQLLAKSGRTYTVTYSATDGTGNQATASAMVTVQ